MQLLPEGKQDQGHRCGPFATDDSANVVDTWTGAASTTRGLMADRVFMLCLFLVVRSRLWSATWRVRTGRHVEEARDGPVMYVATGRFFCAGLSAPCWERGESAIQAESSAWGRADGPALGSREPFPGLRNRAMHP